MKITLQYIFINLPMILLLINVLSSLILTIELVSIVNELNTMKMI